MRRKKKEPLNYESFLAEISEYDSKALKVVIDEESNEAGTLSVWKDGETWKLRENFDDRQIEEAELSCVTDLVKDKGYTIEGDETQILEKAFQRIIFRKDLLEYKKRLSSEQFRACEELCYTIDAVTIYNQDDFLIVMTKNVRASTWSCILMDSKKKYVYSSYTFDINHSYIMNATLDYCMDCGLKFSLDKDDD